MSYLSQFIIEIAEYEQLYSSEFLSELCHLQSELSNTLKPFEHFTPYRSIFHVANYFACLAPESRVNCSYLTQSDIVSIRQNIEGCVAHRKVCILFYLEICFFSNGIGFLFLIIITGV